jgi:hypothetical protein
MTELHQADLGKRPESESRQPRALTRHIDPELVQQLEARLRSRKPEHIMEQLGISLNTWLKLLAGEPIRVSVADRLLHRFSGSEELN